MPTIDRRRPATAAVALLLAGATVLSMTSTSAAGPGRPAGDEQSVQRAGQGEARGFYDVRSGTGSAARQAELRSVTEAAARPATRALSQAIGGSALVDLNGVTGTPRLVARLDGYLTRASQKPPRDVALDYVADHLGAFGLEQQDLATFHLRDVYTDIEGIRHLSWTQTIDGLEVFGFGLQASVTEPGRLLTIGGSPVPSDLADRAEGGTLDSRADAIEAARRDLGETSTAAGPDDRAERVLFVTRRATFLGWRTITMSAQHPALSVLDARTGRLLYRRPLAAHERGDGPRRRAPSAKGLAFRFFPGSANGGEQRRVNFTRRGWLDAGATTLDGNNTHTWSDVRDDDVAQQGEEVMPSSGRAWDHVFRPFHLTWASFCDHPYPCSWNPYEPYSWKKNRKQAATQAFFYVNNFHDHLRAAPIGFTEAAGNFQATNGTGQGRGGDAVRTHTSDGADGVDGLPDGQHVDNANMTTPPDGMAPTMQLYLQHQPGTTYPDGDPYSPTNVADEADTVYHEYTHGLSNRLVVDPNGNSSLGGVQAGAMGEGWSDWYAMDYLVTEGLQTDRPDLVDVILFAYDGAGVDLNRTEPLDCKKRSVSPTCDGAETGHTGGYTYADYGTVVGLPEVHADGEIWAQTLWDLRDRIGSADSRSLVTRAMELAPYNPSFLDMRNALLIADTAVFDGSHRTQLWRTFAKRGMGYFAGSLGGDDTAPGADGHRPPKDGQRDYVTGTVRDADTGQPVSGVPVTLAFQGGAGLVNPSATTAADGTYRLGPVPVGTYRKLVVSGAGYDVATSRVTVVPGGAVTDLVVRRDWAAAGGGAVVSDFTGPDYSPECGPAGAIDLSLLTGWGSTTGDDDGTPTNVFVPKHLTVDLGRAIDVTELAVDPSATCGDGGSASTAGFRIQTSPDGSTWTTAAEGTFTVADRGRLNPLTPVAGTAGVRYVRFTMLGNQTPDFETSCPGGGYSGCSYTDLTELEVYGSPS